jgi:ATP-dependent helicase/nuclease subunit B
MDEEDRMAAFAAALPRADFLRGVPVFVDEFDYLPPRTVDMLSALLHRCGSLTVALTADLSGRDAGLFEAGNRSAAALAARAQALGCPVRYERAEHGRADREPELRHLETELYALRGRPYEGRARAIHLWEAAAAEQEVEAAAGLISSLVREQELRWRDVAVVCGDLPGYLPRVERIFARHGIPVFLDNRRPVLQHPLVGMLLAALQVCERGWRREDVVAYLKTGYAGVSHEQTERLERYLAGGWYRGAKAYRQPFVRPAGPEDDLSDLNAWREAFVGPLSAMDGPARRPALHWTGALTALMAATGVEEQLEREVQQLEEQGEDTSAHSQMFDAVTAPMSPTAVSSVSPAASSASRVPKYSASALAALCPT